MHNCRPSLYPNPCVPRGEYFDSGNIRLILVVNSSKKPSTGSPASNSISVFSKPFGNIRIERNINIFKFRIFVSNLFCYFAFQVFVFLNIIFQDDTDKCILIGDKNICVFHFIHCRNSVRNIICYFHFRLTVAVCTILIVVCTLIVVSTIGSIC